MNLPVPVYLRPLDQKDASMKVLHTPLDVSSMLCFLILNLIRIISFFLYLFQLWCAAGVNLCGGKTLPELMKQTKGSQSSLDQLGQESKVRLRDLKVSLFSIQ